MIDELTALFGLIFVFGPLGAWVACTKTGDHMNDTPDILGCALALLHPVFLGVFVALYMLLEQAFPKWLAGIAGAIMLMVFEFLLWRRAVKDTNCALRIASLLGRTRKIIGVVIGFRARK